MAYIINIKIKYNLTLKYLAMPLSILVYINTVEWNWFPTMTFISSVTTVILYCIRLVVAM